MKLLVNVTSLTPPITGIGRYTHQLLSSLVRDDCIEDIRGFDALGCYNRQGLESLLHNADSPTGKIDNKISRVKKNLYPLLRTVARKIPGARAVRQQMQNRNKQRALKGYSGFVYWEPNYILQPVDAPSIVTIHDLSHKRYPQYHPEDRLSWLEEGLSDSINNATEVTTVSEFSRTEIQEFYGLKQEAITVIPPAVSPAFRQNYSNEYIESIKKHYDLPSEYILSVGTLEPRKNIVGLVKAYSLLAKNIRQRYPLVLVGCRGWQHLVDKDFQAMVRRGEVIVPGYVTQEHLPAIYSAASVFAYVSFYEGFGMPVAEAMASGCAVVTSNCASMPEVASGCAELVDPDNIESITAALQRYLEDSEYSKSRALEGRLKSEKFQWEYSAKHLVKLMEKMEAG